MASSPGPWEASGTASDWDSMPSELAITGSRPPEIRLPEDSVEEAADREEAAAAEAVERPSSATRDDRAHSPGLTLLIADDSDEDDALTREADMLAAEEASDSEEEQPPALPARAAPARPRQPFLPTATEEEQLQYMKSQLWLAQEEKSEMLVQLTLLRNDLTQWEQSRALAEEKAVRQLHTQQQRLAAVLRRLEEDKAAVKRQRATLERKWMSRLRRRGVASHVPSAAAAASGSPRAVASYPIDITAMGRTKAERTAMVERALRMASEAQLAAALRALRRPWDSGKDVSSPAGERRTYRPPSAGSSSRRRPPAGRPSTAPIIGPTAEDMAAAASPRSERTGAGGRPSTATASKPLYASPARPTSSSPRKLRRPKTASKRRQARVATSARGRRPRSAPRSRPPFRSG
eukprot:PLAT4735.1.p1 GENE.PLAT4735.1~~PLAT4735.1.p1  ORF type:complete len:407 (-),score=140.25 PLAT4735.1:126-1346(-)